MYKQYRMNFILNTGNQHDDIVSNIDLKSSPEINFSGKRKVTEVSFKK